MNEPILEVEGLEKYFPVRSGLLQRTTDYVKAVDGVSFGVNESQTLALIGESGSGKSTVAKTIIGIHESTGGSIRFDGEDMTNPTSGQLDRMRSRIQMVFQDPTSSLNPRRSVKQSLSVPLKAQDVPKQERNARIVDLLNRVELNEEYLHKYPHELSGGQKQRVNIARALAIDPEILLLDEPTSALDVSVQAKIISLLEELQDELGLTYLFITHDLSLVRNVADRTAVMYLGQIQEVGPTEEVFGNPQHPYSRALLSAIPVSSDEEELYKPRQEPLEGEIPSPRDIPSGCRFHTRCPYTTEICRKDEPSVGAESGEPGVRCHIYDKNHEAEFGDTSDLTDSMGSPESTTAIPGGDSDD